MVALECPACRRVYGSDILLTMEKTGYFWNPAPGYSVSSLRLPSRTFLVTCPHCSAETEFTQAGCVFERPREGVRGFTRIITHGGVKTSSKAVIRLLFHIEAILLACLVLEWWLGPPAQGPSFATQTKEQRAAVKKRVVAAGGWAALRSNCESLVTNTTLLYFKWSPPRNLRVIDYTNNVPARTYITNLDYGMLPPMLAALQPSEVEFSVITNIPTVVRIKLFGMRSTGWGIPYYGLWVVCGAAPPHYQPPLSETRGRTVTEITNRIFEVHQ